MKKDVNNVKKKIWLQWVRLKIYAWYIRTYCISWAAFVWRVFQQYKHCLNMFKVNNNQQIIKQTLFNKPASIRKTRVKIITQNKLDIKSWLGIRGAHFLLIFSCIHYSTSVEPVKATLSISMWWEIAAPAVGPKPGTIFTTPGGNPAWIGRKSLVNLGKDNN